MKKSTLALVFLLLSIVGRAQFNQNFEAGLSGWININQGNSNTWTLLDLQASGFLAHSGTHVISLDASANAESDYLISPTITVTAGVNDYLYFWARNRSLSALANVDVLVSTTGTNAADFNTTLQANVTPPGGSGFVRYGVDLSAYAGQTIHLALHANAAVAATIDIDDIVNEPMADCEPPSGFVASDITANAALLTWLNAGLNNNVQIEYGPSGFALGTGTVVNLTNTLLYNLTGLTANANLDIYIRTNCGNGEYSDWIQLDVNVAANTNNDTCAGATALQVGVDFNSGAVLSTSIGATTSATNTPSCGVNVANDVWFTAVVPANGNLTVQTGLALGSLNLDTVVAVYTGTCGNLTQVACNDNASLLNLFSNVNVSGLTPGSTVYIAVAQNGLLSVLNGAFVVSVFNSSLSTGQFDSRNLSYYPNPVTSTLNLENDGNIKSVKVYNELGQTMLIQTVEATNSQVNMSGLSRGLYFVDVTTDEGSRRLKIVKQ